MNRGCSLEKVQKIEYGLLLGLSVLIAGVLIFSVPLAHAADTAVDKTGQFLASEEENSAVSLGRGYRLPGLSETWRQQGSRMSAMPIDPALPGIIETWRQQIPLDNSVLIPVPLQMYNKQMKEPEIITRIKAAYGVVAQYNKEGILTVKTIRAYEYLVKNRRVVERLVGMAALQEMDYNGDGTIDAMDVQILQDRLAEGDLDGDGMVTEQDRVLAHRITEAYAVVERYNKEGVLSVETIQAYEYLLTNIEIVKRVIRDEGLPRMDYNGDGTIDAMDVQILQDRLAEGDLDGDGMVTEQDRALAQRIRDNSDLVERYNQEGILSIETIQAYTYLVTNIEIAKRVLSAEVVARMDYLEDGVINAQDLAVLQDRLNEGDLNGDGIVTAEERVLTEQIRAAAGIVTNYLRLWTGTVDDIRSAVELLYAHRDVMGLVVPNLLPIVDLNGDGEFSVSDCDQIRRWLDVSDPNGDGLVDGRVIYIEDLTVIRDETTGLEIHKVGVADVLVALEVRDAQGTLMRKYVHMSRPVIPGAAWTVEEIMPGSEWAAKLTAREALARGLGIPAENEASIQIRNIYNATPALMNGVVSVLVEMSYQGQLYYAVLSQAMMPYGPFWKVRSCPLDLSERWAFAAQVYLHQSGIAPLGETFVRYSENMNVIDAGGGIVGVMVGTNKYLFAIDVLGKRGDMDLNGATRPERVYVVIDQVVYPGAKLRITVVDKKSVAYAEYEARRALANKLSLNGQDEADIQIVGSKNTTPPMLEGAAWREVTLRYQGSEHVVRMVLHVVPGSGWLFSEFLTGGYHDKIMTLTKEHLAGLLQITPDTINVTVAEQAQWSDASLEYPEEGRMYAQVITPGYRIILAAHGKTYEYHTDMNGNFKLDPAVGYERQIEWEIMGAPAGAGSMTNAPLNNTLLDQMIQQQAVQKQTNDVQQAAEEAGVGYSNQPSKELQLQDASQPK